VKINPGQQVPQNVPAWAKEKLQSLITEGDKLTNDSAGMPDGYVKRLLSEEEAVLGHWGNRRSFARMKVLDNNEELAQDRDPAPNKVDVGWAKFQFNGGFKNGSLVQTVDDETVNVTLHQGSVSKVVDVRSNGFGLYQRLDSRNPENSVAIETAASKQARAAERMSEHFSATAKVTDLVRPSKADSLEERAASLFLHDDENLPQVRGEILQTLQTGVAKLPKEQQRALRKMLQKPNANTPRQLSQTLLGLAKANPEQQELKKLRELSGTWQVLEDAPKLMADGLVRTQEFYMAPGTLQMQAAAQGWDFDQKSGLPIADTVVVGGGPGGLATGYHLSEQGQRTVIFEGGNIGQGFSDASAQSVHQLRTTSASSDLIYTNSNTDLGIDVALRRQSEAIRDKGDTAKTSWNEFRQESDHSSNEGFGALNRNNLFEHMVQIGHGLATKYPDTFMIEKSPITSITKEQRGDETLFRVKSEKGHEMLSKTLVMATGFVGSSGEYARGLKQFAEFEKQHPDAVTVLGSDHDIVGKNEQLMDHSQALVFSDRLLGRPEIRERIKSLPAGSNLAVIGSGESAAKGTIEALYLNPELTVDLYTKNPLEPYQVQIPVSHFSRVVTEHAIKNKELADETLREFEELKTPITTETMKDLLTFESEGRLRVRELGKRFNEQTVDVQMSDKQSTGFRLTITDPEVADSLKAQRQSWTDSGLYGNRPPDQPADELPDADMVMMAVGYDTSRVNASPLMQQLIDQDLVEIKDGRVQYGEDGLTSILSSQVGFNTAGAVRMSADTALPGRAVRGLRLAQNLATKLPKRKPPAEEDSIASGLPIGSLDTKNPEEFPIPDLDFARSLLSFKTNGARPDTLEFDRSIAEAPEDPDDRAWAENYRTLNQRFSGPNSTVLALVGRYQEFPETLTPAERLTAERALEIAERLEKSGL
jgi:FAD dependent oxidoreductase